MAQEGFPTDVSDTADPCKTYIAAPQDSWSSVAEIYSVTETDLRDANPDVAGNVSSGVKLRIPPYKDSCPSFTNDPRPNVLGASKGVSDQNGPPSGFRINLFLSGRPKIDYEFDLSAPFKLTLSKVLNTSRENIRFAKITQLDAASRRAMLQVPEVDLELTIPEATPLAMYANVSRDLSMDSQFANSDLKNFRLEMSSQPVIRIIESSVTYDVDPTPLTGATGNSGPSSSSSPSSTSPATSASSSSSSATPSSSGLSSGAIVGIVVGAVAGVLVLVFAVILMRKKRAGRNGSPLDDGASSLQSSPKGKSVGGSDEEYDNDEIEH
jgi:LysM repeat protein